jgi:hypothetical protein
MSQNRNEDRYSYIPFHQFFVSLTAEKIFLLRFSLRPETISTGAFYAMHRLKYSAVGSLYFRSSSPAFSLT